MASSLAIVRVNENDPVAVGVTSTENVALVDGATEDAGGCKTTVAAQLLAPETATIGDPVRVRAAPPVLEIV